jgi:predicted RNA binding protein YcfA (HicA-like mRNA interferase family)
MGQKRYPTLTVGEIRSILEGLGFKEVRSDSSHEHWEHEKTNRHPRSIVTVDTNYAQFDVSRIKNMIRQSQHTREEFYGATRRTANKAGLRFVKPSTSSEAD